MSRVSERQAEADVLFLTGAGVSIPIGIPAMHGMFVAFLDKSRSGITQAEKRTCQLFTQDLGVPSDLEEFLVAANSISEFERTRVSALIERAVSQRSEKRLSDYRSHLRQYARDAETVRDRILDFMSRTCFQFDREKATEVFSGFVRAAATRGYPVYTTNYDFALEHVATENGIAVHDNFVRQGRRDLWNENVDYPLGDGLTIVKLHGSVTWYSDSTGTIEKIDANTDINPVGKTVGRLVIAPTRFKDIYAQHYFALYSHFLAALTSARVLIVAGHSLRDDYLRAAIVERCRKGQFNVVVVGPTFPPLLAAEIAPARVGQHGLVTHVPFKFEDFADELAAIAIGSSPAQVAEACAAVVHQRKSKSNRIVMKGRVGALRANTKGEVTASVDAYLTRQQKPARLRVWLNAEYQDPEGQAHSKVSGEFLETLPVEIGEDLSGVVKDDFLVRFRIPLYAEWAANHARVTLHVGLVASQVRKPSGLASHVIAQGTRQFGYSE